MRLNQLYKLITLLTTCFIVLGCGNSEEAEEPTSTPIAPKPLPQKINTVTGSIKINRSLEVDNPMPEVLLFDSKVGLDDALLKEQLELFTNYLNATDPKTNRDTSTSGTTNHGLRERDVKKLNKKIDELKADMPPVVVSDVKVNNNLKSLTSRQSLYQRYATPINAINIDNIVDSLNDINVLMEKDYNLLQELAKKDSHDSGQAKADINWMAQFYEYIEQYNAVLRRYDTYRRHALSRGKRKNTTSTKDPKTAFEDFQFEHGKTLQIILYKDAIDTGRADSNGTFELKGQGDIIVVGIVYKQEPVFIIANQDNDFVRLSDLNLKKAVESR